MLGIEEQFFTFEFGDICQDKIIVKIPSTDISFCWGTLFV